MSIPGFSNSIQMASTIFLDGTQKLMYNRTWLVNYQLKVKNIQEDLKNQVEDIRAKYNALRLDDSAALEVWALWTPKRSISSLVDGLVFYARALEFLRSKQTEIEMLMAIQKNPDAVEPHRIAQHQVSHQTLLNLMERASPSDCEELMAEVELGLYMFSDDGEKFEVSRNNGPFFLINRTFI